VTSSSSDDPRPPRGTASYARFIPREELHAFEAWRPGAFGAATAADETTAPAAPASSDRDADVEARIAAARQAGYQDGYRDGLVALDGFKQSYAGQLSAQFARLVERFDAETAALDQRLADAVTATAVALSRQVLRSELAADPSRVARVATEAVDAVLASARRLVLHLNPADAPLVTGTAMETLAAREVRVVADDTVARGGCRVESDLGTVDAEIATRWAQAAAALGSALPWSDDAEAAGAEPPR
jgi:flagellar assembly protein FliH